MEKHPCNYGFTVIVKYFNYLSDKKESILK